MNIVRNQILFIFLFFIYFRLLSTSLESSPEALNSVFIFKTNKQYLLNLDHCFQQSQKMCNLHCYFLHVQSPFSRNEVESIAVSGLLIHIHHPNGILRPQIWASFPLCCCLQLLYEHSKNSSNENHWMYSINIFICQVHTRCWNVNPSIPWKFKLFANQHVQQDNLGEWELTIR